LWWYPPILWSNIRYLSFQIPCFSLPPTHFFGI
jgi:hypothetical protein